jgi:HK97 family phage portal protein
MNLLERAAQGLGSVVRSFNTALAGSAKRPEFLSAEAEQHKWSGGQIGARDGAERRALQNSWLFTAINEKAIAITDGRLHVYWTGLEDEDSLVHGHALERILRRPNPYMGRSFLMQYTHWWTELDGSSYWFLAPDEMGNLSEIWPLPAGFVRPHPGDKNNFVDYYEYQANGMIYKIPFHNVCHFRNPNPFNVYNGLSKLVAAMLPIDADNAMAHWNGSFFGQDNVMPSTVISLSSGDPARPIDPADVEAVKEQLRGEYAAVNRKTVVTNAYDMAVQMLGWSAKDMDFLSGRNLSKSEIFGIYGVPMGMVDANATDANATVHKERFWGRIYSELGMYAEEITAQIVMPWYHRNMEARYDDVRAKNQQYLLQEAQTFRDDMTINERRKKYLKLGKLPSGKGDMTLSEAAGQNVSQAGDLSAPGGTPNGVPEYGQAKQERVAAMGVGAIKNAGDDLRNWRGKAIKSFKLGKGGAVGFVSEQIAPELSESILGGLEAVESVEDIKQCFAYSDSAKGVIRSWRPWSGFEERLAEVTTAALKDQADELIKRVRTQGADVLDDPQTWNEQAAVLRGQLEPVLNELAAFAVERVKSSMGQSGVSVNWALANEQAVNWARQRAGDLITQVSDTTRRMVGEQVGQWAQSSEGLDGLVKRIEGMTGENGSPVFNKVRAETIAITEATNTYAGANSQAWQTAGYAPAAFKPGAHVRCRCYIQPKTLKDGSKVMVWYTARDERVCTQRITTPWGAVEGCRGLHLHVISEGTHLGETL